MTIDWIGFNSFVGMTFRLPLAGYLIAGLYGLGSIWLLVRRRQDFTRMNGAVLIGTILTAPLAAECAVLHLPNGTTLHPLLYLPPLVAATWLGVGPAVVIGALEGLTVALFVTGRLTQPFEMALVAGAIALLLNQSYRGRIGNSLRQPAVAALLVALLGAWPAILLAELLTFPTPGIAALTHASGQVWMVGLSQVAGGLIAGGILQAVLWRRPTLRPTRAAPPMAPPWERHLSSRLLFTLVPIALVAVIVLVSAIAMISYRVAIDSVLSQMRHDAATVSDGIPFFVQFGRSLILNLAKDERLLTDDAEARHTQLSEGLRTVPFFQQLIYFDAGGDPVAAYPDDSLTTLALSSEERSRARLALESGIPGETTLTTQNDGQPAVLVSFVSPINDPSTHEPGGALLGRAALNDNPVLSPVENVLGGAGETTGEGFIVDESGQILLYPMAPERQLEIIDLESASELARTEGPGRAFRLRRPDGTVQLIYLMPIEGHSDWSVAIVVLNDVVVAQAVNISLPILVILVAMAIAGFMLLIAVATRIADPLEALSEAAGRIAQGQLDSRITVAGDDEVGRLGLAFEEMRQRLKSRQSEQEKLLTVSRSVSASLELFRAMPPILSAILETTDAIGVRIALRTEGENIQSYGAGQGAAKMAPLDGQIIDLVEHEGIIVVGQLWRAEVFDTSALSPNIKALVALPLRNDTSFHGALWVGYDHEHDFEEPELTFISTLSGQAAISVANARLFAAAEGGRQRLETILQSTADGIIVCDNDGRVVLMNPAAEKIFHTRIDSARNKSAMRVIDQPELVRLLTDLREPIATLELPERDGKTYYASASTIIGAGGQIAGRVAALRDITPLKELDHIRTVYLNTAAHNIRSPLTYMRGHVTMATMMGDMNEKQRESLDKVLFGIDQITDLTNRLLRLSHLESDVKLDLTLVDVSAMLGDIRDSLEEAANERKATLKVHAASSLPLVEADAILYREAIFNFAHNAIKYSPEKGKVVVRAECDGTHITISVKDSGIGIDPEEQKQLFKAFSRIPQREGDPPKPAGTGLGLALTKAIAEAHSGSAWVQSERGKGSTFFIKLPLRQPEQEG
jgi:two-component system phosphate regulon sensor histidine kinase PhoR